MYRFVSGSKLLALLFPFFLTQCKLKQQEPSEFKQVSDKHKVKEEDMESILSLTNGMPPIKDFSTASPEKPRWPQQPRIWLTANAAEVESKELQIGLKYNLFGVMGSAAVKKVTANTSHELSVHVIKTHDNKGERLTRVEEDGKSYFNSTADKPYVGLCLYASSLSFYNGSELGITVLSSSSKKSSGDTYGTSGRAYSPFFFIDGGISMDKYWDVCEGYFTANLKAKMEEDLQVMLVGLYTWKSPRNECDPFRDEADFTKGIADRSKGSPSCKTNLKIETAATDKVVRCEASGQTVTDVSQYSCNWYALEGESCPLFKEVSGAVSDRWSSGSKMITGFLEKFDQYSHETAGLPRSEDWKYVQKKEVNFFYCDEINGLKCEMQRKPRGELFGLPVIPGTAKCIKR